MDFVDLDTEHFAKESGAVRVQISGEDFEALVRGEPSAELVAKIAAAREDQESASGTVHQGV